MDVDDTVALTPSTIVLAIDKAREGFFSDARDLRIGLGIMIRVQTELEKQGHKGLEWSPDVEKRGGLCDAMIDLLRGKLSRDVKYLCMMTKSVTVFIFGDEIRTTD